MRDLTDITAFMRAADAGSLTGAARLMGVTPSAVSKAVARLEKRLGVRLLNRTPRGLTSTEAGAAFRQECVHIAGDLDAALARAAEAGARPSGTVRLSAPRAMGQLHLLPALPRFRAAYPGVKIDLRLNNSVLDMVGSGIDLAVRTGHLADSGLVARKSCEQRMLICAAPSYLAASGRPDHPDDLARHNCMTFVRPRYGRTVPWFIRSADGATEERHVDGDFRSNCPEALRGAALIGMGLVQLPTHIVWREVSEGGLVSVLDEWSADAEPIWLVRLDRTVSPAVRAATDFIVDLVGSPPYWDSPAPPAAAVPPSPGG